MSSNLFTVIEEKIIIDITSFRLDTLSTFIVLVEFLYSLYSEKIYIECMF